MTDWRDRAACLRAPDPDIFYSHYAEDIADAMSFCRRCPVVIQCLNAVTAFESNTALAYGIWGACTPITRKPLMKRKFKAYGRSRSHTMTTQSVAGKETLEGMLTLHDILRVIAPAGIECTYGIMQQKLLAYLPRPAKIPRLKAYHWAETPELSQAMAKLSRSYQERLKWRRKGAVTRRQARRILSELTGSDVDNRRIRDRWVKRVKNRGLKPCCEETVWGAPLYNLAEDQENWQYVYREVPGINSQLLDQVTKIAVRNFINKTDFARGANMEFP